MHDGTHTTFKELINAGHLELGDGYRTKRAEHGRPGLPILRVAEVLDGRIDPKFEDFVSDHYRPVMGSKISRPGDIILTTKGTVGRVAIMPHEGPDFVYSPQVCYFRTGPASPLVRKYLYYWFKSEQFWSQALSLKGQTDMADYINLADIRSLRITLQSKSLQEAIAAVLGALDEKIAANDRIAATSNNLALALGHKILYRESGLEVSLSDFANITKGASYRSDDLAGNEEALISLKCVGRDGRFQPDGAKPFRGDCKPDQVLGDGDIVVAQTDLTQRAEVIGRPIRVVNLGTWVRMVASLDLAIVRPRNGLTREVLFALLTSQQFHDHALSHCNGTTVLHMSARALPTFRFNKPSDESISRVTATMRPLFARSDQARRENQALDKLRGTLLPKLMSGEIRMREADGIVEGAT